MSLYKDRNGVQWIIEATAVDGEFIVTLDPASPRQYSDTARREAAAFVADANPRNEGAAAAAIEKFAAARKGSIELQVRSSPPGTGLVVVGLLILVALALDGKRRR